MAVYKYFTATEFRKAVAEAVAAGHKKVGYTWDGVQFEHFIIRHVEEVK